MKQEIIKISKQRKLSSFNRARKTKKGYLGVYQNEKVICDRRIEVEIDVWEVRKSERSEDVGNCVNREVGISGSGGTCPTRIV